MSNIYIECHPEHAPCSCADCDWTGPASDCEEIADVQLRIAAGEVVPAGQCPDCGALCHLDDTPEQVAAQRLKLAGPAMLAALKVALPYILSVSKRVDRSPKVRAAINDFAVVSAAIEKAAAK